MGRRFTFIVLVLFGLASSEGLAQKMNFKSYSVSDGLPQAQVHDIVQTQDGYIWMATYGGGLSKFDGTKFVNYTQEDGLRDNAVENLLVDSDDQLWVSTSRGGVGTFRGDSLVYPIENDTLRSYGLTDMAELSGERKWFGTYRGGVFIYDGNNIERLQKADGLVNNTVWDFHEGDDGRVWMGTMNGVSVYDSTSFTNYGKEDGLSGEKIYKIIQNKNGNKWLATNNGITIWDGANFRKITTANGNKLGAVFDIMRASSGTIWIATQANGLYQYQDGSFQHFTQKNGLNSNYTYKLLEDQNNNIWIATDEDGVNLYNYRGITYYDEETGMHNNGIFSIHQSRDGEVWFGTMDGIESYDGQQFTKYSLPGDYENNYIWNIVELPGGDKLIGMPDNSLMRFDGERYYDFSQNYGLGKLYVYQFYIDSNDFLWIASNNGLYKVVLNTKEVTRFTSADGLSNDTVYCIYEDDEGTKWIGTLYGLSIFDGTTFKNVTVNDGLGHNKIHYITESSTGNMWFGTGGGVTQYKPAQSGDEPEINNFDKSDGMRLVNSHFVWFDEDGYLWQGTNGGLQMLDVPSYRETGSMNITHYAISGRGIGMEFNYHAISSTKPQEAWMGSMQGALHLDASGLERDSTPIPLYLNDIRMNGVPVEWQQYTDSVSFHNGMPSFPSVTFPSGENTYGFSFRGLSYLQPDNVSYRYKLEGFDSSWRPVTSDNSAVYTNLNPGEYTFVVQTKTGGGKFGQSTATYDFAVAYPFWQTYWFYSLLLLATAGLIYGYIRIRIGYLEKNRLQELVDEQTHDLKVALEEKEVLIKEIHHRVKNNLAVISGLLELQQGNTENDFASRILSESQRRVQSISMIHEKLYQNERLAEIDFEKYVRELVEIISYSFSYPDKDITVTVDIDDIKLGVDQGIPCGLILNELVSNAYEHAFKEQSDGTVTIEIIEKEDGVIAITVADNGVGMAENTEPQTSDTLGFTLVQTLCQQLEAELEVEDNNPGSRFLISFQKENPSPKVPT